MTETGSQPSKMDNRKNHQLVYDLLLVLLLLAAAIVRFNGIDWATEQYLHPDERHLVNVETALKTVRSFSEYWDTANSTLNPHNVGYTFFVYGTLPIFLVRYVAEWIGQTGYSEIMLVGRQLSAIADLLVVFLVYLTASRVFDRRVGLIAASFSAFTVLQIQISHFFAVDTYLTLFTMLSIYLAVRLATEESKPDGPPFRPHLFVLFGIALGMAVASKLNTVPVAFVLPLAVWVRLSKMDRSIRVDAAWQAAGYVFLAAVVSVLSFRVFQPYAFSGPGFFGMLPNQRWLDNIRELMNQQTGDFDWPPSIQWARRPIWFSFRNMVLWGMGLPMAVMAWGGFLAAGWKMLKGAWRTHLILWAWTAFYFGWQSLAFNPTMRYQIPVYPTLAIFAGWAVMALWDAAGRSIRARTLLRTGAAVAGGSALVLTAIWAVAFAQIYSRPITRVEASEWIYQNVPGPLNLKIETGDGMYSQPLPFPYHQYVRTDEPFFSSFVSKQSGSLEQITYKNVISEGEEYRVSLMVTEAQGLNVPLLAMEQELTFEVGETFRGLSFMADPPPILPGNRDFLISVNVASEHSDPVLLGGFVRLSGPSGELSLPLTKLSETFDFQTARFEYSFTTVETLTLMEVYLDFQSVAKEPADQQVFRLTLGTEPELNNPLAVADAVVSGLEDGMNADGGVFQFGEPVELEQEQLYFFRIENLTPGESANFLGAALTVEGPWDDGLPMGVNGYSGYNGTYQLDLNFDLYADDNPQKLERFLELLDIAEYMTISSSRQWASTTRIPERFPLNIVYYQNLLGCPEDKTIEWCYNVAQPGMFEGNFGFELVKVFQSDPSLGSLRINDQFAEEAFTVYDHPKVFVFQKQPGYDHEKVTDILSAVDLQNVIRLTPKQAGEFKSLLLSEDAQERQRQAGTWSELFNTKTWYNQSGLGAVLVWYLALSILGWMVFPLVRRALPGLPDHGYPLARTAALLLLAYLSWLAGSLGLAYSRQVILTFYFLLAGIGLWQMFVQRKWLAESLRQNWRTYLSAELVFLAAFLLVLLVRFGNPDLWHPFKGGEKPMDFAYFNAILKTVSFPAYDPWYAGGYINYYYFGFVFVGTLVKMLGIVPALAYNIVLPTVFAMIAAGAYSTASNIYQAWKRSQPVGEENTNRWKVSAWIAGISGVLLTAVLGNQGTVKMVVEGMQRLAAQDAYTREIGFFTKVSWTFSGFTQMLRGIGLPFGTAEFYWQPSRVIPALNEVEPITEFPWFTTIYADLHAHFMALALVFLALGWAVSVVLSKAWRGAGHWQVGWSFVFAGISIGVLRPTNTWDLPTYLALGVVAVIYALTKYGKPPGWLEERVGSIFARALQVGAAVIGLAALSLLLFQPFAHWYGLPYSEVTIWKGTHTPLSSYFVHWGLFLLILVFWMGWETRQWMATTPLSALRRLERFQTLIWAGVGAVLLLMVLMAAVLKVRVHFLAIPLAIWAALLLFRPGIGDSKRIVLFMVGTALFLTIFVEVVVLSGDIARMNTVFKFYLQAWVLLAASSAAAFAWTLGELPQWRSSWQSAWRIGVVMLVLGAAMFPLTATTAKIQDRMSEDAPNTLDGMTYMLTSEYPDEGGTVDLEQDYQAIRWMQENIPGTPVIVEANTPLYRWGARFSIYTGLPTVLGWDWHQTQQRGFSPVSEIANRMQDIRMFYLMDDIEFAETFLQEYKVEYIVVGQLERNYFPGAGLNKFENLDGVLWEEVYRDRQTVIYRVLEPITAGMDGN